MKTIFNIYNIPAMVLTFLTVLMFFNNPFTVFLASLVLTISFWASGILLYKKIAWGSIFAMISVMVSFLSSVNLPNNFIDPYFIHGFLFYFYLICSLVTFYKTSTISKKHKKLMTTFLILIHCIAFIFATVDFLRITIDKKPMFMVVINDKYDPYGYIGLGYRASFENGKTAADGVKGANVEFGAWFYTKEIKSDYKPVVQKESSLIFEENDNDEKVSYYKTDEYEIFTKHIESIIVDDNDLYQLNEYLITHTLEDFKKIVNNTKTSEVIIHEEVNELYKIDNINILFCTNNNIFIDNTDIVLEEELCE